MLSSVAVPMPGIGFGDTRYILLSAFTNTFLPLIGRIALGEVKAG